jgi:glycosyltransferase involved in cell wall biosynthesis
VSGNVSRSDAGIHVNNASKLRICLITDSGNPSGVGEHMLGLAAALSKSAIVTFVCPPTVSARPYLERALSIPVNILPLDWARPYANREFSRWLRANPQEVCHVHAGILWEGFEAVETAALADVPVLVRTEHLPHMPLDRAGSERYARMLGQLDKLVCVSLDVRNSFLAAGIRKQLVQVIENGTGPHSARRQRDSTRAALGLEPEAFVVLTVARYTEQKDHYTLLRAVPSIIAKEPRARFVWAGTGPLEKELRTRITELGLENHVCPIGQRDDVSDLMAAADLFVLSSRFEGLPLVLLEAMAAQLPIVATRVCGSAEVVQHRITGLLVRPGEPADLAAAVSELLAKPELARRLGANARVRASRVFSTERMGRRFISLYNRLLKLSREPAWPGPAIAPSGMRESEGASV